MSENRMRRGGQVVVMDIWAEWEKWRKQKILKVQ